QRHVLPYLPFVLVARIGGLETIGADIDPQHEIDDVLDRHVEHVGSVPAASADVVARAVLRQPPKRMVMTKHAAATGTRDTVSLQFPLGKPIEGSPPGPGPMTAMPRSAKSNVALDAIDPITANSANGSRGATRLPSRMPPAARADNPRIGALICDRPRRISQA